MSFTPRLTTPVSGNKYYNTKSVGGYSPCIIGNANPYTACGSAPANRKGYKGLNVMPNCLGYGQGRFHEIMGDPTFKYAVPGNAENLYAGMKAKGLKVGTEPKVGALMIWQGGQTLNGSDGAGHVVVVEKVISSTEVVVSESGWSYTKGAMWIATHKKGANGLWFEGTDAGWMNKNKYPKFLGFVYNPAVSEEDSLIVSPIKIYFHKTEIEVSSINKNNTNYVRLRDLEEKLHLCAVGWYPADGVTINGKTTNLKKLDIINKDNENYVRLRDTEDVLKLCTIGYNSSRKMPTITV